MLTPEQSDSWKANGYLILPGFYEPGVVDALASTLNRVWEQRPGDVVVDVLETNRRCYMTDVSSREKTTSTFKVSDLYLNYETYRSVSLSGEMVVILRTLLQDDPVLCNTLSLEKGSQQADHIDSLFMTPRTPASLVATWIALEDSHPDAGLLRYYPGSHQIPLYTFEDGTYHATGEELPRWQEYIGDRLRATSIEPKLFYAKRGDVLIWHANLVHGGSAIADLARTRNSLVSHFFTRSDCEALGLTIRRQDAGYWFERGPQPVPSKPSIQPTKLTQKLKQWKSRIISRCK